MRVHMEFVGEPVKLTGYWLLAGVLFFMVVPGAWGVAMLCAWVARNVSMPNAWMRFDGSGGEIGWAFILLFVCMVGGCIPWLHIRTRTPDPVMIYVAIGLIVLGFLAGLFFIYCILDWMVKSIYFSWGGRLEFNGTFLGFLAWTLLLIITLPIPVIPPFVLSAFLTWICSHSQTEMDDLLMWKGSGMGILWHMLVCSLISLLILPIPWMLKWLVNYFVSSIQISRSRRLVKEEARIADVELMIQ